MTVLRPWALRPTAAGHDLLPAGARYWVNSQSWKHSTAPVRAATGGKAVWSPFSTPNDGR